MQAPSYLLKFDGSLVVYIDGNVKTFSKDSKILPLALSFIKEKKWDDLKNTLNMREAVAKFTNGKVQIVDEDVYYNGVLVHGALSKRIVELFNLGDFDILPITNFMNNLMLNPSQKSRDQLYGFLDACDLPITPDGCFLAYKMVREDYYDQHTRTLYNGIGVEIGMARKDVDDDELATCSRGLHVASLDYIRSGHYGNGCGARLLICKINPRDVVAVPVDYNNSKMRVCRYIVQSEITNPDMMPKNVVSSKTSNDLCYDDFFETDEHSEKEEEFELTSDNLNDVISVYKNAKPSRILSEDNVKEIWKLINQGKTDTEIQRLTAINRRTVYRVRNRQAYIDISDKVNVRGNNKQGAIKPAFSSFEDYSHFMLDALAAEDAGILDSFIYQFARENNISTRVLWNAYNGKTYSEFFARL